VKVSIWISLIGLLLFSSCASVHVSNPGKSIYTNHHGRSISKRSSDQSAFEKRAESESSFSENQFKAEENLAIKKRKNFADDMRALFWTWIAISLVTLGLFIAAIVFSWGNLALIPIVVVGSLVWLLNLIIAIALIV
jgi:hypothetical protein